MSIRRIYRKTTFQLLKLLSLCIGVIIGLFCDSGSNIIEQPVKYGIPHADYKISGIVKSSDNNLPVKGLLVSIRDTAEMITIDNSTTTDISGMYSLEFSSPVKKNTWKLNVKDIDSTENGSFNTMDTVISIPEDESNGWGGEAIVDLKIDKTN